MKLISIFLFRAQGIKIDTARDFTQQTQYNPITGTLTGYNIKWTSECEYEECNATKMPRNTTEGLLK